MSLFMDDRKARQAIEILTELYGEPQWISSPKEGQNMTEIIRKWNAELSGYDEEEIKQACYRLFRFRAAKSFPSLSQLMAELSASPKTVTDKKSEAERCYTYILQNGQNVSTLAAQRAIWRIYQVACGGYRPEEGGC